MRMRRRRITDTDEEISCFCTSRECCLWRRPTLQCQTAGENEWHTHNDGGALVDGARQQGQRLPGLSSGSGVCRFEHQRTITGSCNGFEGTTGAREGGAALPGDEGV